MISNAFSNHFFFASRKSSRIAQNRLSKGERWMENEQENSMKKTTNNTFTEKTTNFFLVKTKITTETIKQCNRTEIHNV